MRKFKQTMVSKATIKKQKEYVFDDDLAEEDYIKGINSTYEKPHLIMGSFGGVFKLYKNEKNKLRISWYTSFNVFEEVEAQSKEIVKK